MNGIVFSCSNGGEKYPGGPAGSFSNCKLEQMNIGFVLCGRRDAALAASFSKKIKKNIKEALGGCEVAHEIHTAPGLKNLGGGGGMNKLKKS